jgi:hypothetical protein
MEREAFEKAEIKVSPSDFIGAIVKMDFDCSILDCCC